LRSYALFFTLSLLFSSFRTPAPPAIFTLSLHDALPISARQDCDLSGSPPTTQAASIFPPAAPHFECRVHAKRSEAQQEGRLMPLDRKSTRLNSSHGSISYAVFCLKKKNSIFAIHTLLIQ